MSLIKFTGVNNLTQMGDASYVILMIDFAMKISWSAE